MIGGVETGDQLVDCDELMQVQDCGSECEGGANSGSGGGGGGDDDDDVSYRRGRWRWRWVWCTCFNRRFMKLHCTQIGRT